MTQSVAVSVETGAKRVFAAARQWPGWCRSAKTEQAALVALLAYLPRYLAVVGQAIDAVPAVSDIGEFDVVDRTTGNATTDFGAPALPAPSDEDAFPATEAGRQLGILQFCWVAFDRIAADAADSELRKGPRGGGRDVEKIVYHVMESDAAYLSKLGGRVRRDASVPVAAQMEEVRDVFVETATARVHGEPPPRPSRAASLWPLPFAIRRSAWHALDHAWEIEDRRLD